MKRFKARQIYLVFILLLSGFLIAGCGGSGGGGSWDEPDPISPVSSTVPVNNGVGVPIGNKLIVTFTEAMDPATINTTTFTLRQGATPVSGIVGYTGLTAVFTPLSNLAAGTTYTATITTGAKNLAGNPLASDYVWSFTTGTTTDTTAPIVTLTVPADTATDVAINTKITATFSEAMDPFTITGTTFTLTQGATVVPGVVTYVNKVATFKPTSNLATNTPYTATINTAAEDLGGNALAVDKVWNFTTGASPDITAPTVTLTNPVDLETGVVLSKKIQATFNEAMDPLTITTATFTLKQGATAVLGTVDYVGGLVASFTPLNPLAAGLTYTATITNGATDLAGNALVVPAVGGLPQPNPWTFTTVAALPSGPLPVDLGTAGNFVLLTKSGITTTGVTAITGDLGVSPITSAAITGFGLILDGSGQFSTSPGIVTGRVYAADYAVPTPANLTTAISDMETAYTDAAGRTLPDGTELYAGNLSGQTFPPGLYKWSSGVSVNAASTVTLTGGANDVWIFQIDGNLTMNPGSSVTLVGAQAKNVFWQVAGGVGVSFDTGVAFQGNVLAIAAITMNTGATLTGRALAQTNVTLDANTVTAP